MAIDDLVKNLKVKVKDPKQDIEVPKIFDEEEEPVDASGLPFYFKLKPIDGPIKVKAAAVLPLPLYSQDTFSADIKLTPQAYGYSEHNDQPLSFEYIYKNFKTEDFAQLLVTSGILSKAIRYALLYNYFGYPVANYSDGEGGYEMNDITFAKYNNLAKRCLGTDQTLIAQLHKPHGVIWSDANYQTALKERYMSDYVQGFYQLGEMGQIPSFNSAAWTQGIDETSNIEYFSPMDGDVASDVIEQLPGYTTEDAPAANMQPPNFSDLYYKFHGVINPDDISYVKPIGIDAQHAAISAYWGTSVGDTPGSDYVDLRGSVLNSLFFNPAWGVHTNSTHKTYARSWMPSDVYRNLGYYDGTLEAFVNSATVGNDNAGDLIVFNTLYGAWNSENSVENSLWFQTTNSNFSQNGATLGEHPIEFNSLAYITGYPWSDYTTPVVGNDPGGATYHSHWDQQGWMVQPFTSWYHDIEKYAKTPEDGFFSTWKNNWQTANIVSMYKLVPAGLKTN